MRVALLSPPWFAVPPDRYGGIESVVALLADGLVDAGHDVTLFSCAQSRTRARLLPLFDRPQSERIGDWGPEFRQILFCLRHASDFDVISDHTSPIALSIAANGKVPFAHTVHGPLDGELGQIYAETCAVAQRAALISISQSQRAPQATLPWIANCANALDVRAYPFRATRGADLLFLGRLCADKGAHRAIAIADELGVPLKIAGKCREPAERAYFDEYIGPRLNERIEYLGEVTHDEKVSLLQEARAVLFPIDWDEPFGLVMIEAMACGAPVVATRFGAVPEVIDDGATGVIVDDWRQMAAAVAAASAIDPYEQRRVVERRFSRERMVADYEAAFETVIERWTPRSPDPPAHTADALALK